MCTGDRSFPGGLNALIKWRGWERDRGMDEEIKSAPAERRKRDREILVVWVLILEPACFVLVALSRETIFRVALLHTNGHQRRSLLSRQEEAEKQQAHTISAIYSIFLSSANDFVLSLRTWCTSSRSKGVFVLSVDSVMLVPPTNETSEGENAAFHNKKNNPQLHTNPLRGYVLL